MTETETRDRGMVNEVIELEGSTGKTMLMLRQIAKETDRKRQKLTEKETETKTETRGRGMVNEVIEKEASKA